MSNNKQSMELPVVSFHGAKIGLKEGQRIRKIEISSVESLNRELLATASSIKDEQDRLEEIIANTEKNKTDYSDGKIEKLTFSKDQARFFNENNKALNDLKIAIRKSSEVIAKMRSMLEMNKIE